MRIFDLSLVARHQGVSKSTARRAVKYAIEQGVVFEIKPEDKSVFGLPLNHGYYALAGTCLKNIKAIVDGTDIPFVDTYDRMLMALQMWENFEERRKQS